MKPIFLSMFLILMLFAMNFVFPYEKQSPPEQTEQNAQTAQANETSNAAHGQILTSTSYDSCMMNPKYFELPPDDYKGSLKEWFDAHPMPKIQACKNCHKIDNSSDSDNQELYKNRTKQESGQDAYNRMMEAYYEEEQDSKTYTEILKKYLAEGESRKP